jgi:hypothetical protein
VTLADLVPTTPRALGAVRAWVFGVLAAQLALTDFAAIGHLPATLLHPPGVMEYLGWKLYDRLLTPGMMTAFQVLLVGSLAAAALGVGTAVTTKLAVLLYVF